uniref:Uncharacterized protein n=1 Tax=Panagrolaimus sp. PS1159 TaxID=55785 RepID=A0AC35GLG7_9BILA
MAFKASSSSALPTTSSSRKRAAPTEDPKIIAAKKAKFYSSYIFQEWSLPDPVINYITKNPPSSKMYEKMIKCCKHFFTKNPILIVPAFNYTKEVNEKEGIWKFSYGGKSINLEKLKSKLWITDNFSVMAPQKAAIDSKLVSSLVPRIHQCDAENVSFCDQVLSFTDFKFLFSSVKKSIHLCRVTVRNDDGSIVPFEKLLEVCTKVKLISFRCDSNVAAIISTTVNELVNIPHFRELDYVSLKNIPETFDIEAFNAYIKQNQQTLFEFFFDGPVSEVYKNRLEKVIDEIIQTANNENDGQWPTFDPGPA